ncbi:MAG: hypothetical protein HC770_07760 [Pseudanabaena sp. CRU_2_10]|nr:hypothetical protein [Pseudanabaena sp. CRU_2_10]
MSNKFVATVFSTITAVLSIATPALAQYPGYTKIDETSYAIYLLKNDSIRIFNRRMHEVSYEQVTAMKPGQQKDSAYLISTYKASCVTGTITMIENTSYSATHQRLLTDDNPTVLPDRGDNDSFAVVRDMICKNSASSL